MMELHDAYIVLDGVEMNIPLRSMTNDNLDKSNRFIIPGEEQPGQWRDIPDIRTASIDELPHSCTKSG